MNTPFNAGSVSVPLVPYDIASGGPASPQVSQQSSIPRSLTTYLGGHGKRVREIDDVDESYEAKRACVVDPRLLAESVDVAESEAASAKPAPPVSAFRLPSTQDICKNSPYNSWRAPEARVQAPMAFQAPTLAEANPADYVAELYGLEDINADQSFMADDSDSDEDADGLTELSFDDFKQEMNTVLEDDNDPEPVWVHTPARRPPGDHPVHAIIPKIWQRPGPSPLSQSTTVEPARDRKTNKVLMVRKIARDHGNRMDHQCGRRLVLRANTEKLRATNVPTASNIVKSMDERRSWRNFILAGMVTSPANKGTPALCVKEPLVGPPSKYAYQDNTKGWVGRSVFTGPFASARRMASKGKWKVPCDENSKPLCDIFEIQFEEGLGRLMVWTDRNAMKFWVEHKEAVEFLHGARTTHNVVQTWDICFARMQGIWTEDEAAPGGDELPVDCDESSDEELFDVGDGKDGETQEASSQGGSGDIIVDDGDMEYVC